MTNTQKQQFAKFEDEFTGFRLIVILLELSLLIRTLVCNKIRTTITFLKRFD